MYNTHQEPISNAQKTNKIYVKTVQARNSTLLSVTKVKWKHTHYVQKVSWYQLSKWKDFVLIYYQRLVLDSAIEHQWKVRLPHQLGDISNYYLNCQWLTMFFTLLFVYNKFINIRNVQMWRGKSTDLNSLYYISRQQLNNNIISAYCTVALC